MFLTLFVVLSPDGMFGRCQSTPVPVAEVYTYDVSPSVVQRFRTLLQKLTHRGKYSTPTLPLQFLLLLTSLSSTPESLVYVNVTLPGYPESLLRPNTTQRSRMFVSSPQWVRIWVPPRHLHRMQTHSGPSDWSRNRWVGPAPEHTLVKLQSERFDSLTVVSFKIREEYLFLWAWLYFYYSILDDCWITQLNVTSIGLKLKFITVVHMSRDKLE